MEQDTPEYMVKRKLGIIVLSASSKARQEEVNVTTVEDIMKAFTQCEVERAVRARELLVRLGYSTIAKAIQMLNNGGIIIFEGSVGQEHCNAVPGRRTCARSAICIFL